VSEKAHIGDVGVFKFGLEWQLGHILQLSRYNTETRKYDKHCNDQSVEVTEHVGVLCSWYQFSPGTESTFELLKNSTMDYHSLESYVCTLPERCILLQKKCSLSIVETSFQSSVQQISPTKRSTSTSTTGTIVIPDNSENDYQIASAKDLWTRCGGISQELQRLLND